jgi:transposase InsO family protein
MESEPTEQALRQEAIRRRLQGERRVSICRDLQRSLRWFSKWWAEYRHRPQTDLADHPRVPRTLSRQLPGHVVQAVIGVRQALEAAATPATRYGLIGHRAIQGELERLGVKPLPSLATIQRILAAQGLTHPRGVAQATAYYPWPVAWALKVIHATDIVTRHLRGGEEIQHSHTIDHYSQAVALTQPADKTSATACAHLLRTWARLGLPLVQQFDNDGTFCGGHTHPHVPGRVVRLCLFCGIEPWFIPVYEPKRNHYIETFHSLWRQAFWSRQQFHSRAHVQAEVPLFLRWYHTRYRPPALEGSTPAQVRRGSQIVRLSPALRRLLPQGHLPLTAGRVHVLRKVDGAGTIALLNDTWVVGRQWSGAYIRATLNTAQQTLTLWHQAEATAPWHLIKTYRFRLQETVHAILPPFRRHRARCHEHWPG